MEVRFFSYPETQPGQSQTHKTRELSWQSQKRGKWIWKRKCPLGSSFKCYPIWCLPSFILEYPLDTIKCVLVSFCGPARSRGLTHTILCEETRQSVLPLSSCISSYKTGRKHGSLCPAKTDSRKPYLRCLSKS